MSGEALGREEKRARLEQMARELEELSESPLYEYRQEHGYSPVVGEGDPEARILFVGEAPGKREAESGRPFVGRAGRLLDELLASVGLDRKQVYITNVVKDRPPKNRDPHVGEIELYAPFLERQIDLIRPRVIVPLGRFATEFVLEHFGQQAPKIGEVHGQEIEVEADYGPVTVVPMYHPAAAFYAQGLRETIERDVQILEKYVSSQ
jgi:uracil-DNA glycosylase